MIVATTNRTPSAASSARPRSRDLMKFGRSLSGTAHTWSNAFCAALVTPSPAQQRDDQADHQRGDARP